MNTILGKKIGMTQIFSEAGEAIPVTVIEAGPVVVTQIKTTETDGYNAVQIGYSDVKEKKVNKPMKGHFEKWQAPFKKHLVEVKVDDPSAYESGQVITIENFEEGKKLDITGVSKGKGTAGLIKRWGQGRGPTTHGSKYHRGPGALSGGTYPSRVFKGNHGAGRMGHETVTVQNIDLVKVMPERNILLVKGAVPGPKGGVVRIQYAVKGQGK